MSNYGEEKVVLQRTARNLWQNFRSGNPKWADKVGELRGELLASPLVVADRLESFQKHRTLGLQEYFDADGNDREQRFLDLSLEEMYAVLAQMAGV